MLWKDIVGFEGLYSISEYGDIKSSYKNKKILKPKKDKDGYFGVALSRDGKAHHLRVHRLVALTFIDNKDALSLVNHKDLDINNNHYTNLEWCTHTHNTKHYYDNRDSKRVLSSLSKDELILLVEYYLSGKSHKELKEHFRLDCRADAISEVVTGRRFSEITGIVQSDKFKQRTTAKVSDECILEILYKVHKLNTPQKLICNEYGLSPAQVSRIVNGSRRKDLHDQFFAKAHSQ